MARCVACNSSSFRNEPKEVRDYKYKLNFIVCSSCGGVVGVMPYYDPGAVGKNIQTELAELKKTIGSVETMVQHLVHRSK